MFWFGSLSPPITMTLSESENAAPPAVAAAACAVDIESTLVGPVATEPAEIAVPAAFVMVLLTLLSLLLVVVAAAVVVVVVAAVAAVAVVVVVVVVVAAAAVVN